MAKLANKHRTSNIDKQNVLAEHEMFEKFGGGETNKQGQAAETIRCQANNAGQFRQAFKVQF